MLDVGGVSMRFGSFASGGTDALDVESGRGGGAVGSGLAGSNDCGRGCDLNTST